MRFTLKIEGLAPLLMHNARLANPLDTIVQAKKPIAAKRTKTDDDHALLSKYEFLGGLYIDADAGPYLPAENIERCIRDAAAFSRQAESIRRLDIRQKNLQAVVAAAVSKVDRHETEVVALRRRIEALEQSSTTPTTERRDDA